MALPETKETLKQLFLTSKKPPNEKIIEMQRSVLVLLGYDPDFGVSCLNNLSKDYPDNRELAMKVQQFALCAQVHCNIACMTDEQREAFYKEIPLFMHHCPHLHVMQQQMKMQREMMQRQQQQQHQSGGDHDHRHGHAAMSPMNDPSMMARVQEMMQSPEARGMMEALSAKFLQLQPKVISIFFIGNKKIFLFFFPF
jgi:hypothetical protein